MTTQVLKDSTATLLVYPPAQHLYQASAADVRIRTPSTGLPAEGSEEACTVDSVSTTLSSAATRGDISLALTSGAGVVARKYLIVDNADRYLVDVAALSGTTAYLSEPLLSDISSGASFLGVAISHALTAEETSTAGRTGLAKFRATLNSIQQEWDQWFEVVPEIFPIVLDPTRLGRRGEVVRMRESRDIGLTDLINAAWEDVLLPRLRASGIYEETIHTPQEVVPAHIEACIYLLHRDGGSDAEAVEAQERVFDRMLEDVKASSKLRVDTSETDSAPSNQRPHLSEWEIARITR